MSRVEVQDFAIRFQRRKLYDLRIVWFWVVGLQLIQL